MERPLEDKNTEALTLKHNELINVLIGLIPKRKQKTLYKLLE